MKRRMRRGLGMIAMTLGALLLLRGLGDAPLAFAEKAAAKSGDKSELPPVDAAPLPTEKLLAELRRRNDALEVRERDLARRERSLEEFNVEAKSTLAELDSRRAQVEERIAALEKLAGDGTSRLSKVYGAMPPARAAELLAKLDPEVASVVLSRMKPKISASVMAAMDSEQALLLTELAAFPIDEPEAGMPPVAEAPAAPPAKPDPSNDEAERFR